MLNRLARKRLFLPSDRGVGFGTRLEKVSKHSPNYTVNLQTLLSLRENDEYTQLNLFRWLREVNSFSKKIISDINDCINNLDSFGAPCPAWTLFVVVVVCVHVCFYARHTRVSPVEVSPLVCVCLPSPCMLCLLPFPTSPNIFIQLNSPPNSHPVSCALQMLFSPQALLRP